jgi:hypothetical protein
MALLEQYIIDEDNRKRVVFVDPDDKSGDEFAEYQAGYPAAPNKLEYNLQLVRNIHERHFPNEKCTG